MTDIFLAQSTHLELVLLMLCLAWTVGFAGFLYALVYTRFDVADVLWGAGIAFVSSVVVFQQSLTDVHILFAGVAILIWGVRLAVHIGKRFVRKGQEDPRYALWRSEWKYPQTRGFLQVFFLQSTLMVVLLSPLIVYLLTYPGFAVNSMLMWLQIGLGMSVWVIGFLFEVVGDWQLEQFIKNPNTYGLAKGDLMTRGLWSLTRHPNYFGEMTMWWGVFIILMPVWNPLLIPLAALGPIMISCMLYFVSGVQMTEKNWHARYGEKFEQYKKDTPPLFPKLW